MTNTYEPPLELTYANPQFRLGHAQARIETAAEAEVLRAKNASLRVALAKLHDVFWATWHGEGGGRMAFDSLPEVITARELLDQDGGVP